MLLCFALLEGISLALGLGISDFLSDLLGLPDGTDVPGDLTDSPETGSSLTGPLLSWLEVGKVPVLVSLCAFLAAFSIGGMILQQALILIGLHPLIQPMAAVISFFAALPILKYTNHFVGRCWPKDETSAFSPALLIGRIGVVTIGTATSGRAAEVKVTGPDGRPHYVMCFAGQEEVPQGKEMLLQRRDEATGHYHGILNTNTDLSPDHYF